jgi:hypothetical protein
VRNKNLRLGDMAMAVSSFFADRGMKEKNLPIGGAGARG